MAANTPLSWSDLPAEILFLIISSLCILDRIRCRLVCRSWNAAERHRPPPPHLPWLMLSLRPNTPSQRFFSLTGDTIIQVRVPDGSQDATCHGSIDRWLIFNYKSKKTLLFNPLSKSRTLLPQGLSYPSIINTRLHKNTPHFLRKVIYSSPPDTTSDRCHLAAIYDPGVLLHGSKIMNDLALGNDFIIEDILFDQSCNTKLWAISIHERLYVNELRKISAFKYEHYMYSRLSIEKRVMNEYDLGYKKHVYLVQLCGSYKLLMILRYFEGESSDESTVTFRVYELVKNPNLPDPMDANFIYGNWVEKNSLDGHVIFLSSNCSRAVLASKYEGFEEDKIYFCDEIRYVNDPNRDRYECGDVGVFSLKDETITRLMEDRVNLSASPTTWFFHSDEW